MNKELENLTSDLTDAWEKLAIDEKIAKAEKLEQEISDPDIWKNPEEAKQKNEEFAKLSSEVKNWTTLKTQIEDIKELLALDEKDLANEIKEQLEALTSNLEDLKQSLKFTGPYDHNDAILRITSGAGGTEAMDWAGMLERMYLRFFEKSSDTGANANSNANTNTAKLKATLIERTTGEEAGIKTAVYEISGQDAYGWLKSEHGVHRLVRLSPFNADNLRQTSFALVEILPVLKTDDDIKLDEKDLRIDTYHSGGHGGQGVNTTNSAIRITHLPTNTVVAIQNERSQLQNKEKALEILRGKLAQLKLEQNAESLDKLRAGESASWGQQIRNYVMQPYKLVKDTRTKHGETDVDAVLDGTKLQPFIDSYLDMILGKKQ